jgi:hypothetical protein
MMIIPQILPEDKQRMDGLWLGRHSMEWGFELG